MERKSTLSSSWVHRSRRSSARSRALAVTFWLRHIFCLLTTAMDCPQLAHCPHRISQCLRIVSFFCLALSSCCTLTSRGYGCQHSSSSTLWIWSSGCSYELRECSLAQRGATCRRQPHAKNKKTEECLTTRESREHNHHGIFERGRRFSTAGTPSTYRRVAPSAFNVQQVDVEHAAQRVEQAVRYQV